MNIDFPHCSNNKLEILCRLLIALLIVLHVETQTSYYMSLLCIYYYALIIEQEFVIEIPTIVKECYLLFIKLK